MSENLPRVETVVDDLYSLPPADFVSHRAAYVTRFKKAGDNKEYAQKELNRLQGLIGKGNLAQEKLDDLTSRSNILKRFLGSSEERSEL